MNASEFNEHFERAFNAQALPATLKKIGGKTPKWMVPIEGGSLYFKLATDSKGAGLLKFTLWPGEHRMHVTWVSGRGKERTERLVSLFQYTTESEASSFTDILRGALRKYLDAGGYDPYGSLRELLTSDLAEPKPNVDTFYYHFDAEDARLWGEWYGSLLAGWVSRFVERPESNEDWAWRVLWPDRLRAKG